MFSSRSSCLVGDPNAQLIFDIPRDRYLVMHNQDKNQMKNLFGSLGFALLIGWGGVACSNPIASQPSLNTLISQWSITNISQLLQTRPQNTLVTLRGKVQAIAPLVGTSAYQLEDASGKIWVLTSNPNLPKVGDIILIKGQTRYESILVAGQDRGELYIQEQEILERQPLPARPLGTNLLPENRPSP